ncbi:beta-N-acetylhexosaminidase [Poriferisphaera sp. WC338]|uniref:beta-N-acetylhexosaminidase n=1 Tax=Poriferisphaera sp. WC338 TaxID=3425129 RepID=UPI003D81638F
MQNRPNLFMLLLVAIAVLSIISPLRAQAPDSPAINIIPKPNKIILGQGVTAINTDTQLFIDAPAVTPELTAVADQYRATLSPATGFKLPLADKQPASNAIVLKLITDDTLGDEGYTLTTTTENITVAAQTTHGLFYGLQTLRQLLPAGIYRPYIHKKKVKVDGKTKWVPVDIKWTVPTVQITDKPRFTWRGLHLDEGRHFFGKTYVKRLLDIMAAHKLNRFHWHLTEDQGWRIEIKKYPKLTEIGSRRDQTPIPHMRKYGDGKPYGPYFYTQDEIREVVAYAQKLHITIVPEIEMPGHSSAAISAYPWLGNNPDVQHPVRWRWGIAREILSPDERTFTFLEDVLYEVMQLFPGEYIHIGGDEAPKHEWKASKLAQEVIKREGLKDEHELQSWFIRRIEKYLNANGRRLIGWDEILEGGLAPNATVMSWRGEKGGIAAAKAGHDVVMTPNNFCYLDHYQSTDKLSEPPAIGNNTPLRETYGYDPIPPVLTEDQAKHILGVQGNVWTEYIPSSWQAEYMTWPRGMAIAETAWSAPGKNYNDFLSRLQPHLKRFDMISLRYRPLREDDLKPVE